jgi:hypothetical protein
MARSSARCFSKYSLMLLGVVELGAEVCGCSARELEMDT